MTTSLYKWALALGFTAITASFSSNAQAALVTSYQFYGKGNWSLDAVGSNNSPVGFLEAFIPSGSTIEKAFLYSSTLGQSASGFTPNVTFDGTNYSGNAWTYLGQATNGYLRAFRTDVTTQVTTKVGNGGGSFSFAVLEDQNNSLTDGELLAVIFSNPSEQLRTIAFLDGAQDQNGDSFAINYASPVDTTISGFEALFSLGIGYGFQGNQQYSIVDVNGRRLTSSAGGQDDGEPENGALITVGGLGDNAANPNNPFAFPTNERSDDELYNLALGNSVNSAPFIGNGATSTLISTQNPSFDDLIFFAGINITAEADINPDPVPEPLTLLGVGTAISFGAAFKRKLAQKQNSKN